MRKTSTNLILLFSISVVIFFTSLGGARLWDRDEPRNAGCAQEMLQRGDLIVPTFNAQLRHQKPVLLYWLMMSAYTVFGVNEFSARFWSAALGTGTVFLTYGIAKRWLNARVGFFAAIILATSVMFDVAARAATPDSLLIFCSTLAIWFYSVGVAQANQVKSLSASHLTVWFPTQFRYVLGMYVAMSFGVLAKGPVGMVLPTAIIGMFLLVQRLPTSDVHSSDRSIIKRCVDLIRPFHPVHFFKTCWAMRPVTAIMCLTLIAAPWFVLVGLKTDGEFLRLFFVGEHFGRATTVLENHSGGPWYYPITILVGFFPWSVFWLPVSIGIWQTLKARKPDPLTVFLLCWVGVQVGLFTIAKTKLPSYVTPCYPALAILTSVYFDRWINSQISIATVWTRLAATSLAICGLLVIAGFIVLDKGYLPGTMWLAFIGGVPLVGGIVAFYCVHMGRKSLVLTTMCATAFCFCFAIFPVATTAISEQRNANLVLDRIADSNSDQKIASFELIESTWVYYGKHAIDETHQAASAIEYHGQREFWNQRPIQNFELYCSKNPGAVYVTTNDKLERLQKLLPEGYVVVQEADYFLRNQKIVLLAPTGSRLAIRAETSRSSH